MKIVILCGGLGTRLKEITEVKPKPMVEIGNMPILWHIMKIYAYHGFNDFILCLGYKGEIIKEYFYHCDILSNDFTINLRTKDVKIYSQHDAMDWNVTLVDTGLNVMTGAMIKRIEKYIDGDAFMLTYGDGVTDLNIKDLLRFHEKHGRIGTVTGVYPPSRYGEMTVHKDQVISFNEKPILSDDSVNGGFFIFKKEFFNYLSDDDNCILEKEPLEELSKAGELRVYRHNGFWQCMDMYRDLEFLNKLWESGKARWKLWD